MQSAILLLFVACSFLLPYGLQTTHLLMPCYISPYVEYNVYDERSIAGTVCVYWDINRNQVLLISPRIKRKLGG